MSKMSENHFDETVDVDGSKAVEIKLLEYIPNAMYSIKEDPNGQPIINLMVTSGSGGQPVQLVPGDYFESDSVVLNFGSKRVSTNLSSLSLSKTERSIWTILWHSAI